MGSIGAPEILVILVVALIVLGPTRLPEAGRQVGKALSEIRRWTQDMKSEVTQAFDTETSLNTTATAPVMPNPANSPLYPDRATTPPPVVAEPPADPPPPAPPPVVAETVPQTQPGPSAEEAPAPRPAAPAEERP